MLKGSSYPRLKCE